MKKFEFILNGENIKIKQLISMNKFVVKLQFSETHGRMNDLLSKIR